MTLQRRTPLRAEKPLARSGPIRRKPAKVRAGAQADGVKVKPRPRRNVSHAFRVARSQSFSISGGLCVICGCSASHGHHRMRRSQGGPDTPANILPLCGPDHSRVHANPELSFRMGFLLHSTDEIAPWWLLPFWAERRAS